MPPRYAYWTILTGGLPTAFRAAEREELLPTFRRIREKHPDAEMKYFARGKLWRSPEEARASGGAPREPRGDRSARGSDWRPGGAHRDPRQTFKDAKKARNQDRRKERFERQERTGGRHDRAPGSHRPPSGAPSGSRVPGPGSRRPDQHRRPPAGQHRTGSAPYRPAPGQQRRAPGPHRPPPPGSPSEVRHPGPGPRLPGEPRGRWSPAGRHRPPTGREHDRKAPEARTTVAHIVLFRPRADLPLEARRKLAAAFEAALTRIPSVRRARVGRRIVTGRGYESRMHADYPYAAVLEFDDPAGLIAYLEDRAHEWLASEFYSAIEEALMYDFELSSGAAALRDLAGTAPASERRTGGFRPPPPRHRRTDR